MPKVHAGTTTLKNVKAQVCSQAHYANRKILIDFSGLCSLPKFGLEPDSQSHCQCTHTELHSQPKLKQEQCPGNGSEKSERQGQKAKHEG